VISCIDQLDAIFKRIRYSGFFVFQILVIAGLLFVAGLDFFHPVFKQGFFHYDYVIKILLALTFLIQIYRQVYAVIINKPILTVTDKYLYDFVFDIKYYWKDIVEIYEKNGHLFINLYYQEDYLNKIGNPLRRFVARRWFKPGRKKTLFFINLDIVEADPNKLLEIFENYRMSVFENENS
jgi:hypothetical protein